MPTPSDNLSVLRDRCAYLSERVKAKQRVGWEFTYDQREQQALAWAIGVLELAKRLEETG